MRAVCFISGISISNERNETANLRNAFHMNNEAGKHVYIVFFFLHHYCIPGKSRNAEESH